MAVSNPEVIINNIPFAIVPNSFEYDEGESDKMIRAAVIGNSVTQEYSENYEDAFSEFKFSAYPSVDNLDLIRDFEKNANNNTVTCTAGEVVRGVEKTWRRTFKNAGVLKVKKPLGADTTIEINWKSDAAV